MKIMLNLHKEKHFSTIWSAASFLCVIHKDWI